MQADFFEDLEWRGLVKQLTDDKLKSLMNTESLSLYVGFDPTSDSLHIGHLLPLLILKRFQVAGHRPIAVVGGATGMIGDPSGKSAERNLLTADVLEKNVAGIRKGMERFLETSGPQAALIVSNADWFKDFSFIEFLRDVGKHFTVNYMMTKDSVRTRLEDRDHGISYTEFSYMLLQAYDFYYLNRTQDCRLQVGGSDQWGNITAGGELIRRMAAAEGREAPEVFGMTNPLLMKADGGKFGKTESGTIWLDRNKTSPYQFYQFLIRTADADAAMMLKFFTFLKREEIEALEESLKTTPEKREAQRALARELTQMVHGEGEVEKAEQAAKALFGTEVRTLDKQTLLDLFSEAPATEKPQGTLQAGLPLIDLLVETGLCKSKGAARKDVTAGGVYINNERTSDVAKTVDAKDLIADHYLLLRKGKKNYHLVSFK